MSKAVWYPLSTPEEDKIKIDRAEGIHLFDKRQKEYIDANSGLWNVPLGYSNEAIKKALYTQVEKFSYVNPCECESEASEELGNLLKGLLHEDIDKIIYACSGSEAIEIAIKLIRKYSDLKRKSNANGIAVLQHSYHGSYYGSMSCSNYDGTEREGYGPLLSGIYELKLPFEKDYIKTSHSEDWKINQEKELELELENLKGKISGIIFEPILGSAGVIRLPKWYIDKIDEFARENDVIIVCDEIATGFCRTGSMFAYEEYGIKPDIITMSKGINNGTLPLAAIAVGRKITKEFSDKFLFHLSTQNANALCCATAQATIKELIDGDYVNTVKEKSKFFKELFNDEIGNEFSQVYDLRSEGMMFAVELRDKEGNETLPFYDLIKLVELIKKNGVISEWSCIDGLSTCLVMLLPYVITDVEMYEVIKRIKKSLLRIIN
ncbi:MAG: aspartate aminotransferase family protein [Pseudobutyrivibrio sp.]|nr:aspartate aminotransferase family protein [Pseudobutyrivibrio sp.]